ncbi:ABC transporter permease [Sphingomonas sp. BT553]|uniref:ABC transporter permease n=1 Tax=Sphingomonas mollis TaxID=2795726 RepID=A0ABS0XTL3_9SPHN|nr:ABC transporter permease [Sphingomonas sp. BT553]
MATSLYRSLTRHKLFAALNIGGLALGIAVFLVLYLFVRFETGYDRVLPGWQRVWMVDRSLQFPGNPRVEIPSLPTMLGQMKADYPGTTGARFLQFDAAVQNGTTLVAQTMAQVDPAYFRLFQFPVLEGDPATALARPDGIVITAPVARSYFGKASSIGRTLTVVIDGKAQIYRIGAVLRPLPGNISYTSDLFTALAPDATGQRGKGFRTFLSFPDAIAAARVTRDLPAFVKRHPDPDFPVGMVDLAQTRIVPLASVHLAADNVRTGVTVLGAVGAVALLLAVVNYVNLATARAGLRAREIAMRKVVGATRRALVLQLLGEALVAVTLASLTGLALAEIALPFISAIGGTDLTIAYLGANSILPPLALLVALVSLLAGFHPAFVLSRFQPAGVLAAARTSGGDRAGARLRKVLVVLQFGIAIALMICTAVLVAQIRHVQNADLGFARNGLIMAPSYGVAAVDASQRRELFAAIRTLPGVTAVTTSGIAPTGGSYSISAMHRAGATGEPPMILQATIGDRFFETYGVKLLAGRLFDPQRFPTDETRTGTDADKREHMVVVNRTTARRLGFATPAAAVGQSVSEGERSARIVGVVADMRFATPREPLNAVSYSYRDDGGFSPVLVVRAADTATVLARMEMVWRRIVPNVPFAALTVDQKLYDSFYRQDVQRSRLFTIGAILAALIGCIGLYGLAAFDTARRVQEIGIRKVLGASTGDVLRLLLGQFLRPVALANLIAWPIAWVAMSRWLGGFDDRINLSPLYFIVASALALAIAAATVAGQAWRVARAEPARALRQL